jgi:hypothetical protein
MPLVLRKDHSAKERESTPPSKGGGHFDKRYPGGGIRGCEVAAEPFQEYLYCVKTTYLVGRIRCVVEERSGHYLLKGRRR